MDKIGIEIIECLINHLNEIINENPNSNESKFKILKKIINIKYEKEGNSDYSHKGSIRRLAEQIEVGGESLYKSLADKADPKLTTFLKILKGLDLEIKIVQKKRIK